MADTVRGRRTTTVVEARLSNDSVRNAGLCANCAHARLVRTPRSVFTLCERSRTDPAYERYPRLPVRQCPGHEVAGPATSGPGATSGPPQE